MSTKGFYGHNQALAPVLAGLNGEITMTASGPMGLEIDTAANVLLIGGYNSQKIYRMSLADFSTINALTMNLSPYHMVLDAPADRLYVNVSPNGGIRVYQYSTLTLLTTIGTGKEFYGLAKTGNYLYAGAYAENKIYIYDTAGTLADVRAFSHEVYSINITAGQNALYITDPQTQTVRRYTLDTYTPVWTSASLGNPVATGAAWLEQNAFVTKTFGDTHVLSLDTGAILKTVITSGRSYGLALDLANGRMIFTQLDANKIPYADINILIP